MFYPPLCAAVHVPSSIYFQRACEERCGSRRIFCSYFHSEYLISKTSVTIIHDFLYVVLYYLDRKKKLFLYVWFVVK